MRTEIKTYKIYEFNELSEEAKERAIEQNKEVNTQEDWYDYLHEGFIEELNTIGINCKEFYWNLYGSRDFNATGLQVTDEQKLLKSAGLTKWLIMNELREDKTLIYCISLNEYGTADIEFEQKEDYEEWSNEEYADREKEAKEIEEKITEFMKEKFEKFWKIIEKEYSWFISDEAIKESMEANEYEFTENGERY